ncbi:MAG: TetR/AcrR family transcriptional regulator [Gammaproteobacteria bacterium]|nr:TetR/AcrR family transcriptional regulator [Gammaproteobacteria bacterium]
MKQKGLQNRQRIIESANQLFYQRGYNQTSFSEIADVAEIPKGNFYYYFKSKDDLLAAVIDFRVESIQVMLDDWAREIEDPRARLKRTLKILIHSEEEILRYGCPMGSLNVELSKTQLSLQSKAVEMFDLLVNWITQQMKALGHEDDSRTLALHMLACMQGISMLTNVYSDSAFMRHEVTMLEQWLDQL